MRNLTMALRVPQCALYHRTKRLEFRLVFIDAGHLASDPVARPSRCLRILPILPDFGNSLVTSGVTFAQDDQSARAAIAILRSRDVSCTLCSRKAG